MLPPPGVGVLPDITEQKIDRSGDCWIWIGPQEKGYGRMKTCTDGVWRTWAAHRFVYYCLVGEIPSGASLDHLCRNTACVNPDHLEPVTWAENTRRQRRPGPTLCGNQRHPWVPENLILRKGYLCCRECARETSRRSWQRRNP